MDHTDVQSRGTIIEQYEYLRAVERLGTTRAVARDGAHNHQHMQDLAAVLGVKKTSVSAAVSKLERRELADRHPCERDARAQHVILTAKARAALAQEEVVYDALNSWVKEHKFETALDALGAALDQPKPTGLPT